MTNYTYQNIWNNTMNSTTVSATYSAYSSYYDRTDMIIRKRNGAIIRVTPFEVNEYSDDDITTEWLEAKRYVTIHLCGVVAFEYEEKVIIDYINNEMYTEVEGYEVDTCGVYIH